MTSPKETKHAESPPPVPIDSTPVPIIILIFHYLDQLGLMHASSVSKHWHQVIHLNPGMAQHRISPVLKISASQNKEDAGRSVRLMEFLQANVNKLQRSQILELHDVNKFYDQEQIIQRWFQLEGIVSLDVSSPSKVSGVINMSSFIDYLLRLPNLRKINLSNIGGERFDEVLDSFSTHCLQLERIIWNNIDTDCDIWMTGFDMRKATNLREIIMDESIFTYLMDDDDDIDTISDLENNPRSFLFHYCTSQVLERISIRHAKYSLNHGNVPRIFPQNALIKYIRNAPRSLRWFRSDLSVENIEMLQLERLGIEFVN